MTEKTRVFGKLKRFIYRVLCGFVIGVSVVAPGFSGSVVAIIMGIYYDLIRIVSNPFKQFKRNVIFCVPLGVGALISLVLFLLLFKKLFETNEMATYLLFIGLIAGNIPTIIDAIKKCAFKKRYLFGAAFAFILALTVSLLSDAAGQTAAAGISSHLLIWALSGLLAGASALVPGLSVSMILILMGVYGQLIFMMEAMLHMNFEHALIVVGFVLCAIAGLALAARGIKRTFDKYPGFANSVVLGFMGGSLIGILTQSVQLQASGAEWLFGGAMLALGLAISFLFVIAGKKMNISEEQDESEIKDVE